jgi:hypothetical protein
MDMPVSITDARSADLLNPGFEAGLLAATGFVMKGRTIKFEKAARPSDQHIPFITNRRRQLAGHPPSPQPRPIPECPPSAVDASTRKAPQIL